MSSIKQWKHVRDHVGLFLLGIAIVVLNYLWWKPLFIYVWNYWTNA